MDGCWELQPLTDHVDSLADPFRTLDLAEARLAGQPVTEDGSLGRDVADINQPLDLGRLNELSTSLGQQLAIPFARRPLGAVLLLVLQHRFMRAWACR